MHTQAAWTRTTHDRLYRGEWHRSGPVVTVHESPGEYRALPLDQPVCWGAANREARALALVILRDALDGAPVVDGLQEDFTREVIAALPPLDPFILWRDDIEDWVRSRSGTSGD
ncbi:MAG: DUF6166 domain-containing protein [Candidatus Dormibacteria bacterium]